MFRFSGRLFGEEILPVGYTHTSGPFGIHREQTFRVFFTSRTSDEKGLVTSHPFFVDVDPETLRVTGRPKKLNLPIPLLGSYRTNGIFPFSVFELSDGTLMAMATGWNRMLEVSVETAVGVFYSLDFGETWVEPNSGPMLSAKLDEPFLVCDASYLDTDKGQLLAYCFGTDWIAKNGAVERRYLVTSSLGTVFDNLQTGEGKRVIKESSPLEAQAYPSLNLTEAGDILMAFSFREVFDFRTNPESSYKIGFALSQDGISWTRSEQILEGSGQNSLDNEMQAYAAFSRLGEKRVLLYNGNGFGRTGVLIADPD